MDSVVVLDLDLDPQSQVLDLEGQVLVTTPDIDERLTDLAAVRTGRAR